MDFKAKLIICWIFLPSLIGSTYLYDYQSDVAIIGDEKVTSHRIVLSLESKLRVTSVWNGDANNAEKLVRFQLENFQLVGFGNSTSQPIRSSTDLSSKKDQLVKPFYARYLYGKLQDFFVEKSLQDENLVPLLNIQRGIISMFQFQSGNWEGDEIDLLGSCWTTYTNDQHGLHKKKTNCKELETSQSDSSLFGTTQSWRYDGLYHLQKDGDTHDDEMISRAKITEIQKLEVNLMPHNPRWTKVTQNLILKEQIGTETNLVAPNVKDAIIALEGKEKISIVKTSFTAQLVKLKSVDGKIRNILPKLKRQLQAGSLATKLGAKAFLQLREAFSVAKKEDLVAVLKDNKNHDILPQLMDILGFCESTTAYSAAIETFANPSQTNRPDLGERYLWALAQVKVPNTLIVQGLFAFAKGKISNTKIKETLILTLGTLSRKTTDGKLSTDIIKWLVHAMVESCSKEDCIQMFLRAIENSENVSATPILLQLAEKSDKKTAFYAMKGFANIYAINKEEVIEKIGEKQFVPKILSIYLNKNLDTSIRGIVAEMILQHKPDLSTFRQMFESLKTENKGFISYVLSRVLEYSEHDAELRQIIRSCVNSGSIDWNLLANGGLSTSFGRQVASAGRAGNSSFSFGMEIAGIVLKRSNFQLFFQDKKGTKTDLVQLGVFAGGMSSFVDDSAKDEDDEATAGIEIKFLGNQLRPFVFFQSMGELMSIYWSGSAEEKNSALQGNVLLTNEHSDVTFINGLSASKSTDAVISYDFSGQAKISMWSKTSESVIENSLAYVLRNKVNIFLWKEETSISHEHQMETETSLKVENNLDFGSKGVKVCIRVSQPELQIDQTTQKTVRGGKGGPQTQDLKKKVNISGKTLFLNRKNCDLCNKMYPKAK